MKNFTLVVAAISGAVILIKTKIYLLLLGTLVDGNTLVNKANRPNSRQNVEWVHNINKQRKWGEMGFLQL